MSRRRILHILPELGPGGGERVAATLATGTDSDRFEVGVAALFDEVIGDLGQILDDAGIERWHLGKKLGFDRRMFGRVKALIKSFKPDLIHSHLRVLRYLYPTLRHFGDIPTIHTLHSLAETENNRVGKMVARRAFRGRIQPISIADAVSRSIDRVYGIPNPTRIYNGIPIDRFANPTVGRAEWRRQHGLSSSDRLLVSVGRLAYPKNQQMMVRALGVLLKDHPDLRLILVGAGDDQPNLRSLAGELGVTTRISFTGTRTDIPEILGASDLYLLSSEWEGHPLSIIEAMAAGLPVVSTEVGGIPEIIEQGVTGLMTPEGDQALFTDAIRQLLESSDRDAMGQAGYKRAADLFSLEAMAREYESLYDRLIQNG